MSFDIRLDYRFDTGFFDDPARRDAMEAAAAVWEGILLDELPDVPAGIVFTIDNPSDPAVDEPVTLAEPIDDLLIFVGADALPGDTLAFAGPDGYDAAGDAFDVRVDNDFRGTGPVTDFEPWAGSITFDSTAEWSFDLAGPVAGKSDFISTATHEIGHILGFGSAAIFDQIGAGAAFDGPNALAANGGDPIPLTPDLGHVVDGFAGNEVLMDPTTAVGQRKVPTDIDKAILADIGWEIAGFTAQGATPPLATEGSDGTIFGTVIGDRIDGLGGDDQPQGNAGNDTLFGGAGEDVVFGEADNDLLDGGPGPDIVLGGDGQDTVRGGAGDDTLFGDAGADMFEISAGEGVNAVADFELGADRLRLVDSGFATPQDVIDAVDKQFNNVSRITFDDGTVVRVFHDSQPGTPLTAADIELAGAPPPPSLAIAPLTAEAAEGDAGTTALTFTVTRTGDLSGATTVGYAVAGTGADPAGPADFDGGALPSGTVSFAPDAASRVLTVLAAGDTEVEGDEGFSVTLANASGGSPITAATASGTILNDDAPPPELAIAALAADRAEGDTGTTPFTFTVTRTGDLSGPTSVDWAVTGTGPSPADAADFGSGLPSGTLAFAPNEGSRTLTVAVAGDTLSEQDEGFAVTLSGATGEAGIATGTATGTIRNDDAPPPPVLAITALDAERSEGDTGTTAFTFTVTRTGDLSGATSVDYAVAGAGSDPADAADFAGGTLPSGTLSFAAGVPSRTVTVGVQGDTAPEPDEGFAVTLSGASGGATVALDTATGRILTDDTPGTAQPPQGVLRGTGRDDVLAVAPGAIYLGNAGDDIFLLSQAVRALETSVLEADTGDSLQLAPGLSILSSLVGPTALQLTLSNGAVVQVLNAGLASYEAGANVTAGQAGAVRDYAGFAAEVLGVAVPDSGFATGGPVVVGASGDRAEPAETQRVAPATAETAMFRPWLEDDVPGRAPVPAAPEREPLPPDPVIRWHIHDDDHPHHDAPDLF